MQENAYLFPFECTTLEKNEEQGSTTQAQSKKSKFRGYLNPSTGWVTWASRSSPTTLSLSFEKSLTAWFTYKQIIAVRIIKPYQNIWGRCSVHITSGKPLGTRFSKRIATRPGFSCYFHLVFHPASTIWASQSTNDPPNLLLSWHLNIKRRGAVMDSIHALVIPRIAEIKLNDNLSWLLKAI